MRRSGASVEIQDNPTQRGANGPGEAPEPRRSRAPARPLAPARPRSTKPPPSADLNPARTSPRGPQSLHAPLRPPAIAHALTRAPPVIVATMHKLAALAQIGRAHV